MTPSYDNSPTLVKLSVNSVYLFAGIGLGAIAAELSNFAFGLGGF